MKKTNYILILCFMSFFCFDAIGQKKPNKLAMTLTGSLTNGYYQTKIDGDSIRYNSTGRNLMVDWVGEPIFMRLEFFQESPKSEQNHFDINYHLGAVVFCGKRLQFPLSAFIGGFSHKTEEYKINGMSLGAHAEARLFLTSNLALVGGARYKRLSPSRINGEEVPENSKDELHSILYSFGLCYAFTTRMK